jgi:ELWxxDGT repeat protein
MSQRERFHCLLSFAPFTAEISTVIMNSFKPSWKLIAATFLSCSVTALVIALAEQFPRKFQIAPAALAQTAAPTPQRPANRFTDLQNHWAQTCIERSASQRLLQGYPDSRFVPDGTLTRAEFAALMIKAFPNAQPTRSAPNFVDVPNNHWGKSAITQAYRLGFLTGYPGNRFQPNQNISKVQALTILANAQGLRPVPEESAVLQTYEDAATIPDYARSAIASATVKDLVVNYPDLSQLQPNRSTTRSEAAALLCQAATIRTGSASSVPARFIVQINLDNNNRPIQFTTLIKDFPNANSKRPLLLDAQTVNGKALFLASDDGNGQELWVSDGSTAGTTLVRVLYESTVPNSINASATFLGTSSSRLWIDNNQSYYPGRLAKGFLSTDGTESGTIEIASLNPILTEVLAETTTGLQVSPIGSGNSLLPFVITTPTERQLWMTDGKTQAATRLIKSLKVNSLDQSAQALEQTPQEYVSLLVHSFVTPTTEQFLFTTAIERSVPAIERSVLELWRSDGSTEGTTLLRSNLSIMEGAVPWQNRFYMDGVTPEAGSEWWTSDGTATGTTLLKDIYPGPESSRPKMLNGIGDRFFALANSPSGLELWVTKGTPATTQKVKLIKSQPDSGWSNKSIVLDQKLIFDHTVFAGNDRHTGLWITDGTEVGTQRLAQFGELGVDNLTLFKGRAFFVGHGPDGKELWSTDGTPQGTQQLIDLTPGITSICLSFGCPDPRFLANGSNPNFLTVKGDWLYFIAENRDLYRTDGTLQGTRRIQTFSEDYYGSYGSYSYSGYFGSPSILSFGDDLLISGYDRASNRQQLRYLSTP